MAQNVTVEVSRVRRCLVTGLLATLVSATLTAQESSPASVASAAETLEPGVAVSHTAAPGTTVSYVIKAARGTFVQVVVEANGMRVRVTLGPRAGDGAAPADPARTRSGGDRTPIQWSAVADRDRDFELRVESAEAASPRTFTVRLRDARPAAGGDGLVIEAERLLESGAAASRHADAERALQLAEQAQDRPLQVRALLRSGALLADAGRTPDAERASSDAVRRCHAVTDVRCEAAAQMQLGRLLAATGRPEPGRVAYEEARSLAERVGDTAIQAEAFAELGATNIALARQKEARAALERAIELARAAGHRRAEADATNMLGILFANVGEPAASERHYTAALALRRDIDDEIGAAQCVSNLGALSNTLGEYRRALGYFDEALAVRRRLGLAQATANTLHNLGVARANLGEFEVALGHLEEALAIWRRTGGKRGEAFALQELGQTYSRLGDRQRALSLLSTARPLWRELGDRRGEVQTVLFSAAIQADAADRAAAAASYAAALELALANGLKREQGMALVGTAGLARAAGDLDTALQRAGEARDVFEALGNRRERGRALAETGAVHLLAGRLVEARTALVDARADLEAVEDRAEQGRVGLVLADVSARLGDADAAVAQVDRALDQLESVRRDQQAESLNLAVFASDRPLYDRAIALLMRLHRAAPQAGLDARAFHVSERRRARRLLDMVAAAPVEPPAAGNPALAVELRRAEERIGSKAARLTRLLTDAPSGASPAVESARQELRGLVERADRLRAELRRQHRVPLNDPDVLELPQVQAALGKDAVLIEAAIGDIEGFGWAVTATDRISFALPGRAALEPVVRRFIQAASAASGTSGTGAAGRELAEALLGPAAKLLAERTRMLFVGDGLLDAIPLAALPQPGRGLPLGARFAIEVIPSASVAAAIQARRQEQAAPRDRIAVFADPVYSRGDGRLAAERRASSREEATPQRLRFSREEARAIARLAPGRTQVHLDFDAARRRVIGGALADARYVHLASHAVIDEALPQLSTIELSRVDADGRPQDGAFRLMDVYGLTLNAELVVLSACGTALGAPVASEGLVGFASGFLRAGADRVLASLWPVDDRATAAFMERFYDGLLRARLAPERALRRAQTAMRSDPQWQSKDWAGWVLIGAGTGVLRPPSASAAGPLRY